MRFLSSMFGLFAATGLAGLEALPKIHSRGFGKPAHKRWQGLSRYMPHQGKRECARRLRQWARIEARRAGQ